MRWDAGAYDERFAFVTEYGQSLLDLLEMSPPAKVLDVGCGTGAHAATLAARGFDVLGVDVDAGMLARARSQHPGVRFLTADVQTLDLEERFDAAISNAALHWMPDQAAALRAIRGVLRPGAPFVAEMGGARNVATVDAALQEAAEALGLQVPPIRKFFPTVAQQAVLLEAAGFDVELMRWFPRPTPLQPGQTAADWSRLFRADVWAAVPAELQSALAAEIDHRSAALQQDGGWVIDYWRLRFVCHAS